MVRKKKVGAFVKKIFLVRYSTQVFVYLTVYV